MSNFFCKNWNFFQFLGNLVFVGYLSSSIVESSRMRLSNGRVRVGSIRSKNGRMRVGYADIEVFVHSLVIMPLIVSVRLLPSADDD